MSYRLSFKRSVEDEVRRIAGEQIEACFAAAASDDPSLNVPHEIRKQCKKLRALFRLVRGSFPSAAREQRVARDAGHELAAVREVAAHLDALARLRERDPARYGIAELDAAHTWLSTLQIRGATARARRAAIDRALVLLGDQRARIPQWRLHATGFDAVSDGLAKTYRNARRAFAVARVEPTPEHLHALRKYIKHHRFHLELVQSLWKRPIGAVVRETEDLGDLLGQHHDLHMLVLALSDSSRVEGRLDRDWLYDLVRPEARRLERRALRIARRVLAEKPAELCARFGVYWHACAKTSRGRG